MQDTDRTPMFFYLKKNNFQIEIYKYEKAEAGCCTVHDPELVGTNHGRGVGKGHVRGNLYRGQPRGVQPGQIY